MNAIFLVISCLILIIPIDAFDCGIFVPVEFLRRLRRVPRTLITRHGDTSIDILHYPSAEVGVA